MLRTLIGCLGLALATSVQASEGTPGTAIFICYGKTDDLVVVLEQTNPEEIDGNELLDPEVYEGYWNYSFPVTFNVRLFWDPQPYLIEGTHPEIAAHLLSDEVPSSAYEEFNEDAAGIVTLKSFDIAWNLNEQTGVEDYLISYIPSNKRGAFLYSPVDNQKEAKQDRVNCIDPFLKS